MNPNLKNEKIEDDLDREIDAYFAKNGDEKEASMWPDSLIPSSLNDKWVWEDTKNIDK